MSKLQRGPFKEDDLSGQGKKGSSGSSSEWAFGIAQSRTKTEIEKKGVE